MQIKTTMSYIFTHTKMANFLNKILNKRLKVPSICEDVK